MRKHDVFSRTTSALAVSLVFGMAAFAQAGVPCDATCAPDPCEAQCGPCDSAYCGSHGNMVQWMLGAGPYYNVGRGHSYVPRYTGSFNDIHPDYGTVTNSDSCDVAVPTTVDSGPFSSSASTPVPTTVSSPSYDTTNVTPQAPYDPAPRTTNVAPQAPYVPSPAPQTSRPASTARADYARAGAVAATATAVPDMIGDNSFTGGKILTFGAWGFNPNSIFYRYDMGPSSSSSSSSYRPALPPPTFALTRLNIAENFNGEVQNRIYLDYRHFDGAGFADLGNNTSRAYDVDRYTIGFERKLSRNSSIELRLPIVSQMGADQRFDSTVQNLPAYDSEFGNLSLAYKRVVRRTRAWTHTTGLGLNLPTAPDVNFTFVDSSYNSNFDLGRIHIKNQECRLLPYYALQWHPNRMTFGHFLAQLDIPLNGNDVELSTYSGASARGRLTDETLLRLNGSVGRWLYRNECADLLNRVGVLFEAHYSVNLASMKDRDFEVVGNTDGAWLGYNTPRDGDKIRRHTHVLNLVAGLPMQFGKTTLTTAIAAPITDARYFSTEASVMLNRRF